MTRGLVLRVLPAVGLLLVLAIPAVQAGAVPPPPGPPTELEVVPPESSDPGTPYPAGQPDPAATSTPAPPAPEPPGAQPPKALVTLAGGVSYLQPSGAIKVPLKCRASGRLQLEDLGHRRIGSAKFTCDLEIYRAVATVKVRGRALKSLRHALRQRKKKRLRAKFAVRGKRIQRLLTVKPAPRGARASSGGVWKYGYLSCGRPNLLVQPHLQMFHGGVSPTGQAAYGGFWNDTGGDNWVWYRPYLYFYGESNPWYSWPWRGPIYVPPYTTIAGVGAGDVLGDAEEGLESYAAGVSYVWWYNGYKDWNWVYADTPYFGYEVYGGFWCHIP